VAPADGRPDDVDDRPPPQHARVLRRAPPPRQREAARPRPGSRPAVACGRAAADCHARARDRFREAAVSILLPRSVRAAPATPHRPEARGKFLACGGQKFYARGVTYGTFRPDANGDEYPPADIVRRDFAQMAAR